MPTKTLDDLRIDPRERSLLSNDLPTAPRGSMACNSDAIVAVRVTGSEPGSPHRTRFGDFERLRKAVMSSSESEAVIRGHATGGERR
jgi:hypothetical protein